MGDLTTVKDEELRTLIAAKPELEHITNHIQYFSGVAARGLYEVGFGLIQAKPLVPRGLWAKYAAEFAGTSQRTAENLMAAARRFGDNAAFQNVDRSKLFALLALPEGEEDSFAEEHDLSSMTAREVQEAVRAAKAEMQGALDAAEAEAAQWKARAEEKTKGAEEIPDKVSQELLDKSAEIRRLNGEIDRLNTLAKDAVQGRIDATKKLTETQRDLAEAEKMVKDGQAEHDALLAKLADAQSLQAKGDAERDVTGELTGADYAANTRMYLGSVGQGPFLSFGAMKETERRTFLEWTRALEDYAKRMREALDKVEVIEA